MTVKTIIVDYIKYKISDRGYASVIGYDKRKNTISYIRIPSSIEVNGTMLNVLSIESECFYDLNVSRLELPNTIRYICGEKVDFTPATGESDVINGVRISIYEARINQPKKTGFTQTESSKGIIPKKRKNNRVLIAIAIIIIAVLLLIII